MKFVYFPIVLAAVILSACGAPAPAPTATAVPPTAVPPTATVVSPTATAVPPTDVPPTADPVEEKMQADLQTFMKDGRISSTKGEIVEFEDFSADNNEMVYYSDAVQGGVDLPANFVFSGHFKWSSAADSSDPSGCGVIFAGQESGGHYALFLDREQIYFLRSDALSGSSQAWILGKAAGTGKVNFGNPAEADFSLIVNGNHSYVYVDGSFIGQYDLVKDAPTQGKFGFSVISGTTKDYGVHCEITNGAVWMLE